MGVCQWGWEGHVSKGWEGHVSKGWEGHVSKGWEGWLCIIVVGQFHHRATPTTPPQPTEECADGKPRLPIFGLSDSRIGTEHIWCTIP